MIEPLVLLDRIDAALAEMRRSVPADFLADSSGGMLLALAESRAKACREALTAPEPPSEIANLGWDHWLYRHGAAESEVRSWAAAWRLDE